MIFSLRYGFLKRLFLTLTILFITSCSSFNKAPEYERDEWGSRWKVKNCINVRDRLLMSTALESLALDSKGCDVIQGVWIDFYTGEKITMEDSPEIDHVVPVEHAHSIGGHRWAKEEKSKFYQDKDNLVITTKSMNTSKGSKSFVDWHPVNRNLSCNYAHKWIAVKKKYDLPFSNNECQNFKALEDSNLCPLPLQRVQSCE